MLKVSNIYPILFSLQFVLLFWGQWVLPQQAPPFLDKFCILCNNTCENGPNFHRWIVEEQVVAPDNFEQVGKVINGQFPGPTITIGTFQHLVVLVENRLSVPLTIHWHGLHQQRTVAADGAALVTQADIPPNGKYTYCMFIEDEPGTHMYHAHTNIDIIWIHGALIVKDNNPPIWAKTRDASKYHYDEERLLILEQLFHEPVERFFQSLTTAGLARPATQSLMINGQSFGVWPTSNSDAKGYSVISVQRMKTYRFRLINLSSELMFRFEIEDHSLTVIEMDGIICVPVKVDHVDIHTGQRYSVLVTMDQPVGNYLTQIIQNPGPGPLNGVAILHYEHAADPTPLRKMSRPGASTPIVTDEWIVSQLSPNPILKQSRVYPVPKTVDRTIMIDFQSQIVGGLATIQINGHQFRSPEIAYLDQIRDGVNVTDNLQVFEILQGQHIQLIMQNRATNPTGNCGTHPFHFHGRYFYVAATGPDVFDPERDGPLIDENVRASGGRLQFRDVFVQYPERTLATGGGCGWVAIRLIANNPGIWLTHCHITSHMLVGKMFVLWEHSDLNPILLGE